MLRLGRQNTDIAPARGVLTTVRSCCRWTSRSWLFNLTRILALKSRRRHGPFPDGTTFQPLIDIRIDYWWQHVYRYVTRCIAEGHDVVDALYI